MFKKSHLLAYGASAVASTLAAGAAFAADETRVELTKAAVPESTTVGARIFADFSYIDQTADGIKTPASGVGVDVKRGYLIVTHTFDAHWSANVTTDFNYSSSTGETQLFIKKAYLSGKVSDAFTATLGSYDLPWVPFVENLYGYRYVEKLMVDRLNFGTTADWGVNANGKLGSGGLFNYSVSVINGNGFKNPTRSKTVDVEGRIGITPLEGLVVALGGYGGKRGQDTYGSAPPANTASRFDALLAYTGHGFRAYAEYFEAKNWTISGISGAHLVGTTLTLTAAPNVVKGPATDKAEGASIFAAYDFLPQFGVFARGDWAKPSKDLYPDLKDQYFNFGLAWHARKNVDLSLVYKHEKVDNGTLSVNNGVNPGTIGSGAAAINYGTSNVIGGLREGKYSEVGVFVYTNF
jgi:hypothetical protein